MSLIDIARISACNAWIKCGLWVHGKDRASWGCYTIGGRDVASTMGAVKQHIVEVFKEPVVNQTVKVAVNSRITEPDLCIANNREVRPAFGLGKD